MSSYYKPKTKKICHTDYRKYIVPRDCDEVIVISQEDEYSSYPEDYRGFIHSALPVFHLDTSPSSNHPLVNAGEAYWLNKTQLCTGYTIGNVFRPVFNYKREKFAFEIREYITKFAKIHATHARSHLYKQELMKLHNKKIPVEIIEHISNFAWDIMLLL